MTANQSPPARPDEDALLLDRPLYNFDSVEFVEIKHADWQAILMLARNSLPARDAVEGGAKSYQEIKQGYRDMITPPKPTLDAVRPSKHTEQHSDSKTWTAGIDALRQYDYQDQQWHINAIEVHHKDKQEATRLRDAILTALAAPVPPADGARQWPRVFNVKRAENNTWHADISFARCPTDAELQVLEISLRDDYLVAPSTPEPPKRELHGSSMPPDRVGAAEPVAETVPLANHDEIGRKVSNQPWEIQSAIVTIAAHCTVLTDQCPTGPVADLAGCISQGCLELANALAIPPVRGDRTTFYSILTKYYPKDATMDAAWQELKEAGVAP